MIYETIFVLEFLKSFLQAEEQRCLEVEKPTDFISSPETSERVLNSLFLRSTKECNSEIGFDNVPSYLSLLNM